MFKRIKTPCIGVCSTGLGDNVCRGCKRFAHEVVEWNGYTEDQRYIIAQRLEIFLTQIMKDRFEVFDVKRLADAMREQQIYFNEKQNPLCWVYGLLRAGASQIKDTHYFGFRLLHGWRGRDLRVIREEIDQLFFELSDAHYQRYVRPEGAANSV